MERCRFQSLNRDSGCSDFNEALVPEASAMFQSLNRDSGCSDPNPKILVLPTGTVSIPQSGFWLFRPSRWYQIASLEAGFNPSIGILVVQTGQNSKVARDMERFQSLNRDSGCSDLAHNTYVVKRFIVSIPQSGFWLFRRFVIGRKVASGFVSIPQSGFWLFRPRVRQ